MFSPARMMMSESRPVTTSQPVLVDRTRGRRCGTSAPGRRSTRAVAAGSAYPTKSSGPRSHSSPDRPGAEPAARSPGRARLELDLAHAAAVGVAGPLDAGRRDPTS